MCIFFQKSCHVTIVVVKNPKSKIGVCGISYVLGLLY